MSGPNIPPDGQAPNSYFPPLAAMGSVPSSSPQKRKLQWWHWLLISAGGVIAICCILSAAIVAASNIFAVSTMPSGNMTTNSGQVGCDLATHECPGAPPMMIDSNNTYIATIKTTKGAIVLQLDAKHAPIAVNNFVFLAQSKWYNGTYFWRVETPGTPSVLDPNGGPSKLSLIQGGSVAKDGADRPAVPGYTIQDDNPLPADYSTGTISMANTGQPNSASSQFFIDTADKSQFFSKTYVTFGKVTQGMDVAKAITPGDTIETITITVQPA